MDESNLTQTKSLIAEISTATQKALDDVTSIEGPGGARFETSKIVPTTGFSIAEHHGRVALLIELVRSLTRIDAKHYLTVPSSHLAGLPTELTSVVQAFDDISLAAQAALTVLPISQGSSMSSRRRLPPQFQGLRSTPHQRMQMIT